MERGLEGHGSLITGDEVYTGLSQDRFAPILTEKMTNPGSTVSAIEYAPDNAEAITRAIRIQMETGCDPLLLSGGVSVAPNDVTRHGVCLAGADEFHHEPFHSVKSAGTAPSNHFLI